MSTTENDCLVSLQPRSLGPDCEYRSERRLQRGTSVRALLTPCFDDFVIDIADFAQYLQFNITWNTVNFTDLFTELLCTSIIV